MISFFSKWIEGIALAVIIVSIFEMILPNGNLKKYIKIILGIYVIFSIIAPFVNSKELYALDVDEVIENTSIENSIENQKDLKNDLNKIYKSTFEKEIKQTIEKQGYNVYRCFVEGVFDAEEKDAGIKRINIVLESKREESENINENENTENKIIIENVNKIENVEISVREKERGNLISNEIANEDINKLKTFLSKHYEVDKKLFTITKR